MPASRHAADALRSPQWSCALASVADPARNTTGRVGKLRGTLRLEDDASGHPPVS